MVCEHLRALDLTLAEAGHQEIFRGRAWSENCREWVYYAVRLDVVALQAEFAFPDCVMVHENTDPRSGTEWGFYCTHCHDGVMGAQ